MIFMFRRMVFKYSVTERERCFSRWFNKCFIFHIHFRVNKKCICTVAVVVDISTTGTRQNTKENMKIKIRDQRNDYACSVT
jgi:hypothetical protein